MLFKKLFQYKYNKNILYIQTFLKNFQINHRFGTMERTWYSGCNLGSGVHSVHLLCRCTSIIPIRIVAIYMTNTPLLYQYSLSNQNQTDPYIYCLLTGGSGGSRTLVFNPFLILSTSCALRVHQDSNLDKLINSQP